MYNGDRPGAEAPQDTSMAPFGGDGAGRDVRGELDVWVSYANAVLSVGGADEALEYFASERD
jgi:hypothetical protein